MSVHEDRRAKGEKKLFGQQKKNQVERRKTKIRLGKIDWGRNSFGTGIVIRGKGKIGKDTRGEEKEASEVPKDKDEKQPGKKG